MYISDAKKGKNEESIKGVIANVNTQINKVVEQVQAIDTKKAEVSKPPAEQDLSLSIQHSNREENRFRRVRHGEGDPVTPARGALARASVKLGQNDQMSDEEFEF